MSQILITLSQTAAVEFQFLFQKDNHRAPSLLKNTFAAEPDENSHQISVILYGTEEIATDVGDWLDKCGLYLQLPQDCDRGVRYLNPHSLSFGDENRIMTFDIENTSASNLQAEHCFADVLIDQDPEEIFDESPQPAVISTHLLGHQKRALTFMLGRERGWDLGGSRRDLWRSYVDARGNFRYQNTLSRYSQFQPPTPFNGGILGKLSSVVSSTSINL